jgi:hypothetical protein
MVGRVETNDSAFPNPLQRLDLWAAKDRTLPGYGIPLIDVWASSDVGLLLQHPTNFHDIQKIAIRLIFSKLFGRMITLLPPSPDLYRLAAYSI